MNYSTIIRAPLGKSYQIELEIIGEYDEIFFSGVGRFLLLVSKEIMIFHEKAFDL